MEANGQIDLGRIVFLPQPLLVGTSNAALGQPAAPGDLPYAVTTMSRCVTVPLNPTLPTVNVGETVSIVLPTNAMTPGKITGVGPAPTNTGSPASSISGAQSNGDQSQTASTVATVTPDDPSATGTGAAVPIQVSLTTQSVSDVLAVPISALLALAGGGYGVEVVGTAGVHHLVGVSTGIFTGSRVQISGSGIDVGTKVVVAQ
jgi:hypothetical protein